MAQGQIDTTVVGSKQVMEMITVANDYCLFIEEIEQFDKKYVFSYLQRVLPLLYLKGSLLPETERNEDIDNERYVIEETWEYLFNTIKNFFAEDNKYYFWNPELGEVAETTFAENLADMYQDLKDFIYLFAKPSHYAKQNAVYMCRDLFFTRWGKIIPPMLQQLHVLTTKELNIQNEEYNYE